MKGKILIILGILIVLGSFLAYFLLEAAVVRERNLDPVGVLAAKPIFRKERLSDR